MFRGILSSLLFHVAASLIHMLQQKRPHVNRFYCADTKSKTTYTQNNNTLRENSPIKGLAFYAAGFFFLRGGQSQRLRSKCRLSIASGRRQGVRCGCQSWPRYAIKVFCRPNPAFHRIVAIQPSSQCRSIGEYYPAHGNQKGRQKIREFPRFRRQEYSAGCCL